MHAVPKESQWTSKKGADEAELHVKRKLNPRMTAVGIGTIRTSTRGKEKVTSIYYETEQAITLAMQGGGGCFKTSLALVKKKKLATIFTFNIQLSPTVYCSSTRFYESSVLNETELVGRKGY